MEVSVVTITFSEVPVGFDPLVDLEVVGGTLTNLTADGTTKMYTGTFTAPPGFDGTAKVGVKAAATAMRPAMPVRRALPN